MAVEDEQRLLKAMEHLSDKEHHALEYFHANDHLPLSLDTAESMYQLYRAGKTCDDIRKMKPGFGLGQIVAAKVAGAWDMRLAEERDVLVEKLPGQVMHVQGEAVDFLTRLILVNHKMYGVAVDKFLETGDKAYLKDLPKGFGQIKEYRALLETLVKVTGQANHKVVEHRGEVKVNKSMSPDEAGGILDVIAVKVIKVDEGDK